MVIKKQKLEKGNIMKFAHLSDTHLGYRQFGLNEREKDFYEVFELIIDKIIEENVDFVIHSGDLFETARPSPNALLAFQKGLLRLKGAGIPMFAIAGNHDSVMRKESIPPHVLFKKWGLKVISPINTNYMFDDVFIAGLPYYPSSQSKNLKNKIAELSQKAANHEKSILVLHQGIDKYLSFQYELEIGDIPDNFDYYAFGHLHKYIEDDFGKGKLVYPGSIDIWRTNELPDYKKNGKGFVVVDLDGPKPAVKRVVVESPRVFIDKTISYDNLEEELRNIKSTISDFDKKPIISLNITNIDIDTTDVYEIIKKELGDYALMIRPKFQLIDEEVEELINRDTSLGPKELLVEGLKEFDDESISRLAIDLYDSLSKDDNEGSEKIISDYYDNHFAIEEEEEKDTQTTLEEGSQ